MGSLASEQRRPLRCDRVQEGSPEGRVGSTLSRELGSRPYLHTGNQQGVTGGSLLGARTQAGASASQETKDCGGERLGATTRGGEKQPQETVSPRQPGLVAPLNQGETGEGGRPPLSFLLWKTGVVGSHAGSSRISALKCTGRQSSQRTGKWLEHLLQLIKPRAGLTRVQEGADRDKK